MQLLASGSPSPSTQVSVQGISFAVCPSDRSWCLLPRTEAKRPGSSTCPPAEAWPEHVAQPGQSAFVSRALTGQVDPGSNDTTRTAGCNGAL